MHEKADHAVLQERCRSALSGRGWRCVSVIPETFGALSLLFRREPSRTGLTPELLAVQIADEITNAVGRARMEMMGDFRLVGVVLIAADGSGAPLTCEMGHDDLCADDGPQRLLDIVERLEAFAAVRARPRD